MAENEVAEAPESKRVADQELRPLVSSAAPVQKAVILEPGAPTFEGSGESWCGMTAGEEAELERRSRLAPDGGLTEPPHP